MTYFKALRRRVISGENCYLLNVLVRVVLGQSDAALSRTQFLLGA
jgi:hypothetical protein